MTDILSFRMSLGWLRRIGHYPRPPDRSTRSVGSGAATKELFVLVYRIPVNALVDVVGPGLSPSPEVHDLHLGETVGGELFVCAPLGGTQPRRKTFQTELIPGKETAQRFHLAV